MTQPALPLEPSVGRAGLWSGSLGDLFRTLAREVQTAPDDAWRWRLLPRGALVALKRGPAGRRVLRIARRIAPEGVKAIRAWEVEVEVFRKHFDVAHWTAADTGLTVGVAAAFDELFPGELRPGVAACADCGAEIAYDLMYGCQRCGSCTRRVSQAESDAIQAAAALRGPRG